MLHPVESSIQTLQGIRRSFLPCTCMCVLLRSDRGECGLIVTALYDAVSLVEAGCYTSVPVEGIDVSQAVYELEVAFMQHMSV